MIKAIIFDLDDTLLNDKKSIQEAFRATCELAAQTCNLNPIQLEDAVRTHAIKQYASYSTYDFTQKIGINPFEGLWGTFDDEGEDFQVLHHIAPHYQMETWKEGLSVLGIEDNNLARELAEAFPRFRKKLPFVFEDTYHVLEEIKGKFQLLMLTNGSPSLQKTKLNITPQLMSYFDDIVISGEFCIGKPDPSIFQHILDRSGLLKEEAIMVGDNLHTDILGANRIGMKNVWVNRRNMEINDIQPTYEVQQLKELLCLVKRNWE
jgi:putative hydrolase of the HAD superfamily